MLLIGDNPFSGIRRRVGPDFGRLTALRKVLFKAGSVFCLGKISGG